MSRTKSAFWGSISSQISMIIFMLLSVAITPFILKFLNKEEYGFYVILFQIIGYLSMLDFGLSGAISRNLAANRGEDDASKMAINKIVSTSFFAYSFLGAIVIIVGILFTPYVPVIFKMDASLYNVAVSVTLTLSVFVGIQFPIRVISSIFYAHQRQLLSNIMSFTVSLISSVLPLVFLHFGQALWSFVYTNIICGIIEVIIIFSLVRKYYPFLKIRAKFFNKKLLIELLNFGFFLFVGHIAYQIGFFTDRFFIGSFVSLTAATMYALSVKAPELSRELIFKITDNVYPAMVEISTKESKEKLKLIHRKLLLITTCLATIAFWMIYIFNHFFLKLWVGEGFFVGQPILLLSLLIMFQFTFIHVGFVCLYGLGLVRGPSLAGIIEGILNLSLTFLLGKLYGITGILLATIIAGCLTVMWYIPYLVMKNLKIRLKEYLVRPLLLPVIGISSFGWLVYLLTNRLFLHIDLNWLNFVGISLPIAALFIIFVWILFLKNEFVDYIPSRFKKFLFVT